MIPILPVKIMDSSASISLHSQSIFICLRVLHTYKTQLFKYSVRNTYFTHHNLFILNLLATYQWRQLNRRTRAIMYDERWYDVFIAMHRHSRYILNILQKSSHSCNFWKKNFGSSSTRSLKFDCDCEWCQWNVQRESFAHSKPTNQHDVRFPTKSFINRKEFYWDRHKPAVLI